MMCPISILIPKSQEKYRIAFPNGKGKAVWPCRLTSRQFPNDICIPMYLHICTLRIPRGGRGVYVLANEKVPQVPTMMHAPTLSNNLIYTYVQVFLDSPSFLSRVPATLLIFSLQVDVTTVKRSWRQKARALRTRWRYRCCRRTRSPLGIPTKNWQPPQSQSCGVHNLIDIHLSGGQTAYSSSERMWWPFMAFYTYLHGRAFRYTPSFWHLCRIDFLCSGEKFELLVARSLVSKIIFWSPSNSITLGYHRLYSHRTFHAALIVRILIAIFGSMACQGSIKVSDGFK